MYFVLYSNYRSAVVAAQIMLNIPFAFIGSVLALWLTGTEFSVASLVGFISLTGIASRNGVLMISHYVHLLTREDVPFGREMVIRGSQERVAPVLMTALTAGIALVPLALSRGEPGREILHPVALVVIGGLITSTILDFFVTPTVFLRFGRKAAARLVERHRAGVEELGEVAVRHSTTAVVPEPLERLDGAVDRTEAAPQTTSSKGPTP
jgi:Cu/Ag efflux pump CusA